MLTSRQIEPHTVTWGRGERVVLIHGSLATGTEEWAEQRPLAEHGYELVVLDRRGYGSSAGTSEDYLVDADDVVELLGSGAHLVGHSYGGLSAMLAAARHPEATLSLTVLEPPVVECAPTDPSWRALVDEVRRLWHAPMGDRDWVVEFLRAVGSDPGELPDEFLATATETVPVFRNGRPFTEAVVPLEALRRASFPKLVVSGGHHAGFEAMSADLARRIDAEHLVAEGAGHEIQFLGERLNSALADLWSRARR